MSKGWWGCRPLSFWNRDSGFRRSPRPGGSCGHSPLHLVPQVFDLAIQHVEIPDAVLREGAPVKEARIPLEGAGMKGPSGRGHAETFRIKPSIRGWAKPRGNPFALISLALQPIGKFMIGKFGQVAAEVG